MFLLPTTADSTISSTSTPMAAQISGGTIGIWFAAEPYRITLTSASTQAITER